MTSLISPTKITSEQPDQVEKPHLVGEEQYYALAAAMPNIVWTAKPNGDLDSYYQLWFDGMGAALGKSLTSAWDVTLHPDDLPRSIDNWKEAARTGSFLEDEYHLKQARDAVYRWHLARAVPVYDADGEILKWIGTYTDIEDRKREADISAAPAAIVARGGDAVIGKDMKGNIVTWNESACRLYGYSAEEVVGRSSTMLIPSDLPDELPQILEAIGHGASMEYYETVRVHKDGTRMKVSLILSPVKNRQGKIIGITGIERDISANYKTKP